MKSPSAPPRMTRMRGSLSGKRLMPSAIPALPRARRHAAHGPLPFPLLGAIPWNRAHPVGVLGLVVRATGEEQAGHRHEQKTNYRKPHESTTGRRKFIGAWLARPPHPKA